ncbi:hypothetical protein OTK49_00810 [Vibrio coralliirubri]|uniref:hypothetical protein n=1 Tax=Vibrio coralliirubri TaxID=1516159 RepID=UPI0022844C12|nr:hypothetical protein [Vibrio coralliirubri]MCY9861071.1 hypothetical protein [Vibrio coralliirubri]
MHSLVWVLLTIGLLLSVSQYIYLKRTSSYSKIFTAMIIGLTLTISSLTAGNDFAMYTAYENIRGFGIFSADMIIDGVDITRTMSVSDVVSLDRDIYWLCFGLWLSVTMMSLVVVSLASTVLSGVNNLSYEEVFSILAPFALMVAGSQMLTIRSDFSEGALSSKYDYHYLDISIPLEELQALDAICEYDAAIYDINGVFCQGRLVLPSDAILLEMRHTLLAVWSDDQQQQAVLVRSEKGTIDERYSKAEVTETARSMVRNLNALLILATSKVPTSEDTNKLEWAKSELRRNSQ